MRCRDGSNGEVLEEAKKTHGRDNDTLLRDLGAFVELHARRLGGTSLDCIVADVVAGRYETPLGRSATAQRAAFNKSRRTVGGAGRGGSSGGGGSGGRTPQF